MNYMGEAAGGAPHGLHADLVIGFLCDCVWSMAPDWTLLGLGGGWPFLAGDSAPAGWGFGPLPAPPAHISQGSYLSHASLVTSSDGVTF